MDRTVMTGTSHDRWRHRVLGAEQGHRLSEVIAAVLLAYPGTQWRAWQETDCLRLAAALLAQGGSPVGMHPVTRRIGDMEMELRFNRITRPHGIAEPRGASSAWASDLLMGFPTEDATENYLFSSPKVERLPLRILLVDSHQVVRQGLKVLLEREGFEVVGEASDSLEGVRLAQSLRPEVTVLDRTLPPLNGIAAAREILRESPQTRMMFLTIYTELPYVLEALRVGVRGYVSKGEAAADLVPAIQNVAAGRIHLSPAIVDTIVQAYLAKGDHLADALSLRQLQVLRLQAEGKSTKEIGALLGIGVKTVETHRQRIMQKLDIHDMASIVRYAMGRDLIRP